MEIALRESFEAAMATSSGRRSSEFQLGCQSTSGGYQFGDCFA
jgi:hypothetical protein